MSEGYGITCVYESKNLPKCNVCDDVVHKFTKDAILCGKGGIDGIAHNACSHKYNGPKITVTLAFCP